MKQIIALSIVVAIILFSCTKTVTNTNTVTVTVHDTTTVTIKDTIMSNFDYITRTAWMYKKYCSGYVDSNNLGTVQYLRGGASNVLNLDSDFDTFNPDGTVLETNNGTVLNGNWGFLNIQQTTYFVKMGGATLNGTIVKADKNHFTWFYPGSDGQIKYGELVPKQ